MTSAEDRPRPEIFHVCDPRLEPPSTRGTAMSKWVKRILCPIDLDADSSEQLSLALTLAQDSDAAVCLLYVSATPVAEPSKPTPDWQRELTIRLEKLGSRWFEGKVPYDAVVWSGETAPAILRAAQELNADLIVMATRTRGIDRLILGSVAARVVRASLVPVLTIRPKRA